MEWNLIDGEPHADDFVPGETAGATVDYSVEIAFHELEIVAYVGDLKIVGMAHFGRSGRVSSQRSSDYLRHFTDKRLTLSQVHIYRHTDNELLDTVEFVVLNLERVDLVYAREVGDHGKSDPVTRTGGSTPGG